MGEVWKIESDGVKLSPTDEIEYKANLERYLKWRGWRGKYKRTNGDRLLRTRASSGRS